MAKISYRKGRDMCSFSFTDTYTAECLINLGVVPNKTKNIQPPFNIDNNYIRHYIRGYLDGDGCLRINRDKLVCIFVGQENLLNYINKRFLEVYRHNCNVREGKGNFSYLEYGGGTAVAFCKWIYLDANIYLYRKYEIFNNYQREDLCV
jgi:hypothetical protein